MNAQTTMSSLPVLSTEKWPGHLWRERFRSVALHDAYLIAVIRHVELNPRRDGRVTRADLRLVKDALVSPRYLDKKIANGSNCLRQDAAKTARFQEHLKACKSLGIEKGTAP